MSAMLAKIHCMKKELGLDDETYRTILRNQTGYESAKGLSKDQLLKVIEYLSEKRGDLKLQASKNELLSKIDQLLKAQKKHPNYVKEILSRMTTKKIVQCGAYELEQVIKALETQANEAQHE